MIEPELVVDIKRISETRTVTEEDGGYRVGAAVAGAELKEHPSFSKTWPGVIYAFDLIGSTQIQGRCTLAGNLCNASPAGDSVSGNGRSGCDCANCRPERYTRYSRRGCSDRAWQDIARERRVCCIHLLPEEGRQHRRRLPSLHSSDGDGHRRRWLRRMLDAR